MGDDHPSASLGELQQLRRDSQISSEVSAHLRGKRTHEPDAEQLKIIRDTFDARAATYDESAMHRELADAVALFADLTEVKTAVDVATGTGLVLRALSSRSPMIALTGLDVSLGMLKVAQTHLPTATFVNADAAHMPLADASADLITCVTGLHVIPDTAAALSEWHRLLRPGARAVSATFIADGRGSTIPATRAYPADHRPFETLDQLTTTAAKHGFTITRSTTWTDDTDRLLIAEWAPTGR